MLVRRLLAVLSVLALGAIAIGGCSSGGDAGTTCLVLQDCPTWRCTCRNGQIANTGECVNNQCAPGHDLCSTVCYDRGGLKSFESVPDLTASAECTAFCDKVAALGCGGTCDKKYWCAIGQGECADAKRAFLQCEVDSGAWQCNPGGGFTVSSSCHQAACSADAGLDAAPDAPALDSATDSPAQDATAD